MSTRRRSLENGVDTLLVLIVLVALAARVLFGPFETSLIPDRLYTIDQSEGSSRLQTWKGN